MGFKRSIQERNRLRGQHVGLGTGPHAAQESSLYWLLGHWQSGVGVSGGADQGH